MQFIYQMGLDGRWKASDEGDGGRVLGTVTTNGACLGISLWWIIKRSRGDDFWTWFGPPRSAAPTGPEDGKAGEPILVIKEQTAQKTLNLMPPTINSREMHLDAATNYMIAKSTNGLVRKQKPLVLAGPVDWTVLAGEATKTPGFAFIALYWAGWGSHAVAAHIAPNGYIEWMDPNIGEVEKENTGALKEWFERVVGPQTYGRPPLDNVRIQLLDPTRPDTRFPPASGKLHEM
jgi:hypothetical protein